MRFIVDLSLLFVCCYIQCNNYALLFVMTIVANTLHHLYIRLFQLQAPEMKPDKH